MKTTSLPSLMVAALVTIYSAHGACAAIITGESASSPSTGISNRDPNNVVNNNGITIVTNNLVTDGQITHSAANTNVNNWYAGQASTAPADGSRYLEIDLNGAGSGTFDLDGMRIWNWNENDGSSFSRLDVTSFSVDTSPNGTTWTPRLTANITIGTNLPLASGLSSYAGTYFDLSGNPWLNVQFVRIHILATNWATFNAGQDNFYGGLSEVMFSGVESVPEPGTGGLFLLGALALCARLRNRS